MLVKSLMTRDVKTCRPTSSAGEAAQTMREAGCGCLPVVDGRGRLVGIVTDRDVCRLVATRRDPWDVPVEDVMAVDVVSCRPVDHVDVVLVAMKEHGIRRVPVVDSSRHVKGIVSIDDVILHSGGDSGPLPSAAVLDVLRHICAAEAPVVVPV
jgi:CBS domain-containing protein